MARCRAPEQPATLRREHDVLAAAVARACPPHDQAVALEAVDRACGSALREQRARSQIGRAHARLGPTRDLHEQEMLAEREAAATVREALEHVRRGGVRAKECLPPGDLGLGEAAL